LSGAAITWVEIEGVHHEFSTIPHVKEDTTDFLLNTRAVRIRPLSQLPGKLRLEVEGEGEVCAADIKTSADFEIANPELHLATLDSPEAKLRVEFNVELGRGYVPAGSSDSLPIGTLAPTEAVTQSAAILMEQFSCFRELAKALVEEGAELAWQGLIPPEQYNMPIDQLNISTHTYNSLRRGGITTLGQILEKGIEGLCALAGFGAKSREEVEVALKRLDLPFIPEMKEKKKKQSASAAASEGEDDSSLEGTITDETSDSRTETE
jgi:DNA-directed RNA polymerase subunit alpha